MDKEKVNILYHKEWTDHIEWSKKMGERQNRLLNDIRFAILLTNIILLIIVIFK